MSWQTLHDHSIPNAPPRPYATDSGSFTSPTFFHLTLPEYERRLRRVRLRATVVASLSHFAVWRSYHFSSLASENRIEARCVSRVVAALASTFPPVPLEITELEMSPYDSLTSSIAAQLVSPSASALVLSRVPLRVHSDRPLEIELTDVGLGARMVAAASVARWILAHARLVIDVDVAGQSRLFHSLPVSSRPSGGGWIARALTRPATWDDAAGAHFNVVPDFDSPENFRARPDYHFVADGRVALT